VLIGANPDRLDDMATTFARHAEHLAAVPGDVAQIVRRAGWHGDDAEDFEQAWRRHGERALTSAAELLVQAADALRRNAEEQRQASAAETAWDGAGGAIGAGAATGAAGFGVSPEHWAANEGSAQARAMAGASPAEQAAWWASLTPAERAALIAHAPLLLLPLNLPAADRAAANRNAADSLRDTVVVSKATTEASAGGYVFVEVVHIRVSAELTLERRTYADGHVEITAKGGLAAGAGYTTGDAEAWLMLKGEEAITYKFDDAAAADAFVRDLAGASSPEGWKEVLWERVEPNSHAVHETFEVLGNYSDNVSSATVAGSLNGQGSVVVPGLGRAQLQAGAGAQYDLVTGEMTAFQTAKLDGHVVVGPLAGAGTGDLRSAVTLNPDGTLKNLVVSGSVTSAGGAGAAFGTPGSAAAGELSVVAGQNVNFEVSVNLQDPANQQAALQYLTATAAGDPAAASAALAQLADGSQVVYQSADVLQVRGDVSGGAKVIGGDASLRVTGQSANETVVKPPYGDPVLIR
jgi:uncharacterized protein YukE